MADPEEDSDSDSGAAEQEVEIGPDPTDTQIFEYIDDFARQISQIRQRPLLYLLYPKYGMIEETNSIRLYQEFLESGNLDNLDVILHSTGGDLNEAYDIIKLCRRYTTGEVTVFVPMRAMSAATLISLGADKVILSETGKLGPLDPQIPHPDSGRYMPVRSVTEIPTVLEEGLSSENQDVPIAVKGESIIKPIAEQVDPYFLTEHQKTADLAREYGQKLLGQRQVSDTYASRCLDYLIEYPTHSYSVDLQEIRSTPDLNRIIDAKSAREVEDGIEEALMYLINFFLHWDYKYIGKGEPKGQAQMKLLQPSSHQQLLDDYEVDEEDLKEILESKDVESQEELEQILEEEQSNKDREEGDSDEGPVEEADESADEDPIPSDDTVNEE